jgi:hypothetical protein
MQAGRFFLMLLFGVIALGLTGCDSPDRTLDSIRRDLAAYKANPTPDAQIKIEQGFKKLDTQIEELTLSGRTGEAAAVESMASNLRGDFRAARMVNSLRDAQSAFEGIGSAFKDAGKSIGDVFKEQPTPTP